MKYLIMLLIGMSLGFISSYLITNGNETLHKFSILTTFSAAALIYIDILISKKR